MWILGQKGLTKINVRATFLFRPYSYKVCQFLILLVIAFKQHKPTKRKESSFFFKSGKFNSFDSETPKISH